ncbi:MAG: putative 7-carboxy-7-deazaguanine synthase QueE [Clostridia bacterium]|nr:putative 7-carboxy-7-deazaguanine synthase QueE [Clostridia bacterium]
MLDVVEIFVSINGEGTHAGQLAVFVRFKGCNLSCSYCDTRWANEKNAKCTQMTVKEIYDHICTTGINCVTITGGEPLHREGISELLSLLACDGRFYTEIETNGSIPLEPFSNIENRPAFTMDYKLPSSGMEKFMYTDNFYCLDKTDTVKFVAGSYQDLLRAKEIIDKYDLCQRCNVYISPVFGKIEPAYIVEFMKEHKMNKTVLQLQLHKIIWDPDMKGV